MKRYLRLFTVGSCLTLLSTFAHAQVCNPGGNVMIFSNYDGGTLTINVDVNIPNLKIGIVSYESVDVTITGTYASNVTAVDYSGYNSYPNNHCSPVLGTSAIHGFATPTINVIPPATMSDPDGYPFIICAYNCGGTTGGCNTPEQIEDYYLNMFGGSIYANYTQYGCWAGMTVPISAGGTCCLDPVVVVAPVADFSVSTDTLCVGDCIDITDLSTNTPTSWSWTLSGGTPTSSTTQNPTVCYTTPGSYNITLVATNSAGSHTYTSSILVQGINTSVSVSGTTLTAAETEATYQWLNCGTNLPISGAISPSYTATANGSYAVIITKNGCSDTSSCNAITGIGIDQLFLEQGIGVYPNPTNGVLTIEDRALLMKNGQLTIQNTLGETVYNVTIAAQKTTIDLVNLPKGVYVVRLQGEAGETTRKIVKQ